MRTPSPLAFSLACSLALALAGCGGQDQQFQEYGKSEKAAPEEHEHAHHEHGPHDGHIIELGDHEYHAEVVMDAETKKVTVYLLGHELDQNQPTDAQELTLNVEVDGKPMPVVLTPVPQEGDPEGQSSRFEAADNATIKDHVQDIEELHGRLVVSIGGKSYTAELGHEHAHEHEHKDEGKSEK